MNTTTTLVAQAGIVVSCFATSWWLGGRDKKHRRWGYLASLAGQPFWLVTEWIHAQWGMFALTFWFIYTGVRGYRNNMETPEEKAKELQTLKEALDELEQETEEQEAGNTQAR